jgi:hypothetical protein
MYGDRPIANRFFEAFGPPLLAPVATRKRMLQRNRQKGARMSPLIDRIEPFAVL